MSYDNQVLCNQGEKCVRPNPTFTLPRVPAPRQAICFPCIEAMAKCINGFGESGSAAKDDAIVDFQKRVMGIDDASESNGQEGP